MLRMRHQAEDVEALVRHARYRAHRAVRICRVALAALGIDVAQNHLPALFHLAEFIFGSDVKSLAVLDRETQQVALLRRARERSLRVLDSQPDTIAHEGERAIAGERAGQQMRLAQDLKSVAGADYESAVGGEFRDALHDRREARDRAGAQVVAVAESAGQQHAFRAIECGVLVPQDARVLAHHVGERMHRVAVVERAGEPYHAPLHSPSTSKRKSSITGLASSASHIFFASSRASDAVLASTSSKIYLPTFTSETFLKPRLLSELSTARPCGSRIPFRGVTKTLTCN